MRSTFWILGLFISAALGAQHTISGTFSPAEDYTWLIAYHLKPGAQDYVADGPIKEGRFSLNLPENSPTGTYRLVYALPQEEYHFDVLFTGKEDVILAFDTAMGLTFKASDENRLFHEYLERIQETERRLIAFYSRGAASKDGFQAMIEALASVQHSFESRSKGMVVNAFIRANRPYIPSDYETADEYLHHRKEHYFDALDMSDPTLQASGFLTDKVLNYVFTALPTTIDNAQERESLMLENLRTVMHKVSTVSKTFQFKLLHTVWSEASAQGLSVLADFIYQDHLKTMATTPAHQELVAAIALERRLRLGAKAPDIIWEKEGTLHSLSELDGSPNYVLVFWSSTCGHCLNELPALHKRLKKHDGVQVLAIGLEDHETTWEKESAKLDTFEHAIALGKWESEYAQTYGISSTPTYFILDDEKRIIAKPKDDKAVVEFLENAN